MEHIEASVKDYLAAIGRRGGKAKVCKGVGRLTLAERKAISRKGVEARRRNAELRAAKSGVKCDLHDTPKARAVNPEQQPKVARKRAK